MLELAGPPKTTTKSSSNHRPSDANRRLVFGIHAGLEESAGGYLVLFVCLVSSLFRGAKAGRNPWGARGLEWEVDSLRMLTPGDSTDVFVEVCDINAQCSNLTRRMVLDRPMRSPLTSSRQSMCASTCSTV